MELEPEVQDRAVAFFVEPETLAVRELLAAVEEAEPLAAPLN